MTPEERHEHENTEARGERIAAFLKDEVVQAVFTGLRLSYYEAWVEASDPAEREKLHATARALDDLSHALSRIVASGDRAHHELRFADQIDPDLA
jgi:hypothetical protein